VILPLLAFPAEPYILRVGCWPHPQTLTSDKNCFFAPYLVVAASVKKNKSLIALAPGVLLQWLEASTQWLSLGSCHLMVRTFVPILTVERAYVIRPKLVFEKELETENSFLRTLNNIQ
jgi:hypothetical protein